MHHGIDFLSLGKVNQSNNVGCTVYMKNKGACAANFFKCSCTRCREKFAVVSIAFKRFIKRLFDQRPLRAARAAKVFCRMTR